MSDWRLADLTYEEAGVEIAAGATALLPCGAVEAHGPHLPLQTDVIIAETAAIHAARLLRAQGTRALVLPTLAFMVTSYAAEFPGTLGIEQDTARRLVRDILLSAHRNGFQRTIVCNAHLDPANIAALREAVGDAQKQGASVAFPDITRRALAAELGEEFKSGACHAGHFETSLVLAGAPHLVREDIASALTPNPRSLVDAMREGKTTFTTAGGARAYFGHPATASRAEGEALIAKLAQIFAGDTHPAQK